MADRDLILDALYTPTYDQISDYFNEPAKALWQEMNSFVQQRYKASPKIMYSKCCAKPGWNVKYHKSGKSLCTLYPEKDGFVALVVISLDLAPAIEAVFGEFESEVMLAIKSARPFNGTLWLMLPVNSEAVLNNVKQVLSLKHQSAGPAKAKARHCC